jgi:hypothetical protein
VKDTTQIIIGVGRSWGSVGQTLETIECSCRSQVIDEISGDGLRFAKFPV